ncbi:MAG: cytochrome b/b6 domain-containing protein [Actinomycetota bacterium]|jgi:Ni/Fe-hydrogenase 1 B-type cytochrome subunit|nr:cytochrome b/b6 domain-containing protein [Actinomycetota bacterium]MDA8168053.1 cytochrome b/b6 domain-containing protein [Actinomycetota bacterium]
MRVPPTRQEHPLPAVIMHAVHLVSLLVLIATGLYIWEPYYGGAMSVNRMLHFTFMWVFILTTIVRIYWSFFGGGTAAVGQRVKYRDFHWFWFHKGSGRALVDTIKYYLFLRKDYPQQMKFNPLQKLTYLFWILLIALAALTGLAIWEPAQAFFQPFTDFFGGLVVMRTIHYLITWVFICTVAVHVYLVFAEVIWEVPLMFAWREVGHKQAEEETRA